MALALVPLPNRGRTTFVREILSPSAGCRVEPTEIGGPTSSRDTSDRLGLAVHALGQLVGGRVGPRTRHRAGRGPPPTPMPLALARRLVDAAAAQVSGRMRPSKMGELRP